MMSGFLAIAHFDGRPVAPDLVEDLTGALAFRGPDGRRSWCADGVGMGFAKLATTAEAVAEEQPLGLDGRGEPGEEPARIVADARVDGRDELIARLRQAGSPRLGPGIGDAALILHAYRVWGEELLTRLIGDFAFAIWDPSRRRLFCARDHLGVKPLYYAEWPGGVAVSNTLGCLRRHPRVSDRLEPQAIGDYLLFDGNRDLGTTVFADVRRVPPAHARTWSAAGGRERRYWSLPVEDEPRETHDREDWVGGFRHLFEQAVGDRLRTENDGRVALLMSGGMDSTSVGAVARDLRERHGLPLELRCYTSVYRRLIPDPEIHWAGLAARELGLPHQLKPLDDYRLFERWSSLPPSPEPDDLVLSAVHHDFDELLVRHGRVALTGHGGDPILAARRTYFLDQLKRLRPDRALGYVIDSTLTTGRRPPLGLMTAWQGWRKRRRPMAGYPDWLDPDFERGLELPERWRYYRSGRARGPRHPTHPEAQDILTTPDWPAFFEGWDPGARARPFELRHPFFDVRLIAHVLRMPTTPWCVDKHVLRQAMTGLLPEAIRTRPKTIVRGDPAQPCARPPSEEWRVWARAAPDVARYVRPRRVLEVLREKEAQGAVRLYDHRSRRPLNLAYWLARARKPGPYDADSEVAR